MTVSSRTAPEAMSADEERMFADTVASLLADTPSAALLDRLAELGWFELWAEHPQVAARALFRGQGRLAVSGPVLPVLMGAALTGDDPTSAAPALLPGLGTHGDRLIPGAGAALTWRDALAGADTAVASVLTEGGPALLRLPVAGLTLREVDGLDPGLGLCAVHLDAAPAEVETLASGDDAVRRGREVLALGRRLLAEEIGGVVDEQLRLAVEHVGSRTQFGRAVGTFQAVRHKLAEVHVAREVAELAADEAWADPTPTVSTLAKHLASVAAEVSTAHCQQVLGGIGFTWEHPFHRYARRARLLAALLGSREHTAAELGGELVAAGRVPPVAEL